MRSRIFQLSRTRIEEVEHISEHTFYHTGFIGEVATSVSDIADREEQIERFVEGLKSKGLEEYFTYNPKNQSITFLKGFKKAYFEKQFTEFKEKVEQLTLDEFCDVYEMYPIERLIEHKLSAYIYTDDEIYVTEDHFVRELDYKTQAKYYFGGVVEYKA